MQHIRQQLVIYSAHWTSICTIYVHYNWHTTVCWHIRCEVTQGFHCPMVWVMTHPTVYLWSTQSHNHFINYWYSKEFPHTWLWTPPTLVCKEGQAPHQQHGPEEEEDPIQLHLSTSQQHEAKCGLMLSLYLLKHSMLATTTWYTDVHASSHFRRTDCEKIHIAESINSNWCRMF